MVIQELVTELGFNVDSSKLKKFEAGLNNAAGKARIVSAGIIAAGVASVKLFATQEKAEKQLANALSASGQEVDNNLKSMKDYASELQKVTTVGDEATLELLQMSTSMGLNAEQSKKATKDAIGLSKAFGIDLKAALKATALAQQGNYDMLNRYIPAVRNTKDETEKAAVASNALANAFKVAQGETKTLSGQIEQGKNSFGDFMEAMGKFLAVVGLPLITWLTKSAQSLAALDSETIETVGTIALLVAGIYPLIKAIQLGIAVTKGVIFITKLWTTAQWVLNAALNANPIGLITIGILATIAAVALLIVYWDKVVAVFEEWGHVLKWLLGPLALMINLIVSVVKWWGLLRDSFQAGGIVGVLKEIGAGIFNFMIHPIRKFLEVFSMIPGVGKLAQGALDALNSARDFAEAGTVQGNARTMDTLNSKFGIGAGKATASSGGSTQVTQNTTIQIPAGTPAAQQKFIQQDVAKVMREENQKAYRKTRRGAGRSE